MLQTALQAATILNIFAPPNIKIPLMVATGAVSLVSGIRERRKLAKQEERDSRDGPEAAGSSDSDKQLPKPLPIHLTSRNVTCKLRDKKKGTTKLLLDNVCIEAKPGRLLAILGPSGSGKTTLLNALSGQVPRNRNVTLSGSVLVNGIPAAESRHRSGFVAQEDVFYSAMTVRETLLMAAQLRLPKSTPSQEIEALVDGLIERLGLRRCKDSFVGDKKVRGISGGEKKRLSVACELIASPQLLFLDEPTSGLDSFQAQNVMGLLRDLAASGVTVVCVIHQPRSSITQMFDDICLLSEGRVMYCGAANDALAHFEALGHRCPEHFNAADFLVDLVSIDHSSRELELDSTSRVFKFAAAEERRRLQQQQEQQEARSREEAEALAASRAAPPAAAVPRSGFFRQFSLLFKRSWRQVTRDKATNIARLSSSLSSAVVFGAIFWKLGRGQAAVQDRLGLLQVSAVSTAMTSLIKTLQVFPKERVIVNRERARNAYSVGPYYVAKLLAELPTAALFPLAFGAAVYPLTGLQRSWANFARFCGIVVLEAFTAASVGLAVGAVAPNADAALALGPVVMLVFIVFGGLFKSSENVPAPFRFLSDASLIRQGFEGMCINELQGLTLEASKPGDLATGEQVIDRFFGQDATIKSTVLKQCRNLLFNYWLTFRILSANKPRAQAMITAEEAEALDRKQSGAGAVKQDGAPAPAAGSALPETELEATNVV